MMISKKVADRLNEQVNNEFMNAWTYLDMAYWFESQGLKVFAAYFFLQSDEERGHAMKIARYLLDQGSDVRLGKTEAPHGEYKSAREAIDAFVEHEIRTTKQVHEIVDLAMKENDHATRKFIDWKVEEQVEEVASASELLQMVKMAETPGQLFMLENRLWHMLDQKKKADSDKD